MEDRNEILEILADVQARLCATLKAPLRPWSTETKFADRFVVLYGPRGVGKTHYMLRQSIATDGRYLSMDHPLLGSYSVYEWVEALFQRGVGSVFLDEIHAARNWSGDLKALADAWPEHTIYASGSNSLILYQGIGDLSRRYLGIPVPFLSFREFLVLRGFQDYGRHDPFKSDPGWVKNIHDTCPVLLQFEQYLRLGFRPFFTEGAESYPLKLLQVVQKTILADIPDLVPSISQNHFRLMNAVLGYLAQSPIPTLSVNSLCREWNLGKEKLYSLLHAMEQTGLLRILRYPTDHAAMSAGAKIFLSDPSLYPALIGKEGTMREAFVACALQSSGHAVCASKDETAADFIVDGSFTVEVGGPSKQRKRADFVLRDGASFPGPSVVPLWLLGFSW